MPERAAKDKSRKEKGRNWLRIAKTQTGGARPQTRAASNEKRLAPVGRHASRSEGLPPKNSDRQRENTPGHRKAKSQQLKELPIIMKQPCRSDRWIFQDEAKTQFDAIRRSWEAEFPVLPAALERVLTRLVRADWRQQWIEQRVFEVEETLEEISAAEWTAKQHQPLQSVYRYHGWADRQFHRTWKSLKEYTGRQ